MSGNQGSARASDGEVHVEPDVYQLGLESATDLKMIVKMVNRYQRARKGQTHANQEEERRRKVMTVLRPHHYVGRRRLPNPQR